MGLPCGWIFRSNNHLLSAMFSTGAGQRQDRLENMPCSVQRNTGHKVEAALTEEGWGGFLTRETFCEGCWEKRLEVWPDTGCTYFIGKLQPINFPSDRCVGPLCIMNMPVLISFGKSDTIYTVLENRLLSLTFLVWHDCCAYGHPCCCSHAAACLEIKVRQL